MNYREILEVVGWTLGVSGVVGSLLAAAFPASMLVRYSGSSGWKAIMKILAIGGVSGWYVIFWRAGEKLGLEERWPEVVAGWIWAGTMWLLYAAASRGEELARIHGKIEDRDGRVVWVKTGK
jgi:hypothetical protein